MGKERSPLSQMLALIGIVLVFGAVFGGYVLEHGNPWILVQPAEILIIVGASCGIVLVGNPPAVIRKMWQGVLSTMRGEVHDRAAYLIHLRMLYETFAYAQRAGVMALEADLDDPASSPVFSNYPQFLADGQTRNFICDSLRMIVIATPPPQELDRLMDADIMVHRHCANQPVAALAAVADSLPGFGIVAAVLGVVITMEAIGGSTALIGQKVAAALVGTFLGILLCYGLVSPIAARLEMLNDGALQHLQVLRAGIVSFARGNSPILAVEHARRSVPPEVRPSFSELETVIRREAKVPQVQRAGTEQQSAQTAAVR